MPSYVEIGPAVPEKKIFESFFTIYGRGGHIGHVTSIIHKHVVIGAVYVPPSISRFCTEDELDMFEVEICNTSKFYPSRRSSKMIAAMKTNKTKNDQQKKNT